jgi:holin-like protein
MHLHSATKEAKRVVKGIGTDGDGSQDGVDENLVHALEEGILDERTAIASAVDTAADEEAYRQEIAREGLGNGDRKSASSPELQSPLRVNELKPGTAKIQRLYARPLAETVVAWLRKAFRIILQLGLILAICLAGEKISEILPFDFPSNICSMLLLLLFLVTGVLKMENISDAANFLLDNMAVFFIPAAVAIMGSFDLLAGNIAKLVVICLITTVLVFFVTSYTVSGVAKLMERIQGRRVAPAVQPATGAAPTANTAPVVPAANTEED